MKTKDVVIYLSSFTLALVVFGMMAAFAIALLDPAVDDDKVFAIIGPAFQTVVGGFIGLITGVKMGSEDEKDFPKGGDNDNP